MKTLAPILLALAAAGAATADIAPEPLMTGGTSLTSKVKAVPVVMKWEEVDLWPSPEKNSVKAVFGLKNTGETAVEFEVGFPSYFEVPLQNFEIEIDGKKQLAEVKREDLGGPKKIFEYWLCWKMSFAAGQERKVQVSYWVATTPAFAYGYRNFRADLPEELRKQIGRFESGYVLRTGAGWKDSIGKGVIRVHYSATVKKSLTSLWCGSRYEPKQPAWTYDAKADVDTLTFTDLEPTSSSDIQYEFGLCSLEKEVELLWGALKKHKLHASGGARLLDLYSGGDNLLKLTREHRREKSVEVLEWMLPVKGPAIDPVALDADSLKIVHDGCGRLLREYRQVNDGAKAAAIAKPYKALIEFLLKRDRARREEGKVTEEWIRMLEKELGEAKKALGE